MLNEKYKKQSKNQQWKIEKVINIFQAALYFQHKTVTYWDKMDTQLNIQLNCNT